MLGATVFPVHKRYVVEGHAFVWERKQTDFQKIAGSTYEVEYEITLRNHKAIPTKLGLHHRFEATDCRCQTFDR